MTIPAGSYPIGTQYLTRGKHPRLCTVTDVISSYNSKGDLVHIRYHATHELGGQVITDRDVLHITISMGQRE
jgi:hypothetical protein